MQKPDPEKELWKNIDYISPVKRCPKCKALSLQFEDSKIKCSKCGLEIALPK